MRELLLATALLLVTTAAVAQDGQAATREILHDAIDGARQNCEAHLDDRRNWIAACTAAIDSKRFADPVVMSELYTERGWARIELALGTDNNFDDAIADLSEAARISPDNAYAFLNRANAYMYRGDYQRSLDDTDVVIRLVPTEGKAHNVRCTDFMKLGQPKVGVSECLSAIRLGEEHPWTYVDLGLAYEADGDRQNAEAAYRHALSLDSDWADARQGLQRLNHQPPV